MVHWTHIVWKTVFFLLGNYQVILDGLLSQFIGKLMKVVNWARGYHWRDCTKAWGRGNQGPMWNSAMMSSAFELSPESNSKNLAFVLNDFLFG